ncbi:aldehyde dehydrogenase [Streptomyces sp. B3I8]|uniref:aldehyde dehydrogenase n=1 Tax=Streptomyces sp. B3I8 TaxID=3042303 RepID=UPI0027833D87|nr:aldehyde dehydrogenase [Streptomyces sp. B3I8]MDQ0787102.1 acyl-CoA reductase-like NAD-dependent aldehyde dehydrogenase [Streptomyces sp. B3I8]
MPTGYDTGTQRQELFIGGGWTAAADGAVYESLDPYTGEVACRAAAASAADVNRAVDAASAAFPDWAGRSPAERSRILLACADAIEARSAEISEAVTAEMGGPSGWGHFNIKILVDKVRYAAMSAYEGLTGEVIPSDDPRRTALAVRKPVGVVASIVPWNAPVLLVGASVPAALVLGNTVVMKASEQTPRTHGLVASCFAEGGLPDGVINLITNAPENAAEVVDALVSHEAVRRVHFTGSTRIGRVIADLAGKTLTPVVLELGGNSPFIVLADADLDVAVSAAAFGSFANTGQGCLSTGRIVVDRSIADEFSRRLVKVANSIVYGDPRRKESMYGPLINANSVRHLQELVADAVAGGADLLAGGVADGPCFAPTVLAGVTPAMRAYREESFGPMVTVIPVDGPEEALAVANDNEYGLSSAIFSRDVTLALDLAKRLDVGMCHINGATLDDEAQMPFGGVKNSGYGKSGGRTGLAEFTEVQWITIEGPDTPHYPISE